MASSLRFVLMAAVAACLGCSSSAEAPDHAGDTGTGGTSTAGGPGGKADDGTGPILQLPEGCAPSDMRFECNPITNEGCDTAANEACEYGLDSYFTCFPAPNDVEEGGACDWERGPFCAPSLTCFSQDGDPEGTCRRHCCSDDDCESPSTCVASDTEFGTLGACL